jgi:hypothetical protein
MYVDALSIDSIHDLKDDMLITFVTRHDNTWFISLCKTGEKQTASINGEISGYHGGEYEDDCRMGCCAV